jgi:membrane-bound lytic murein transglycosylase D
MKSRTIVFLLMLAGYTGWSQQLVQLPDTVVEEPGTAELALPVADSAAVSFALPQELEYIPAEETPQLLADRLSCLQQTIPLIYTDKVDAFINYFTIRDRDFTRMALRRKDLYFPLFEKYLRKYNLPEELKYLSVIESGLNPKAVSRARAVGLWQFMSGTGRFFSLHSDWYSDDRMDPELSTEAACRYLGDLYSLFNDWELALAAYNSGPGTVRKAIRRSGYKKTFAEIYNYLPRETRSYVPQYVAVIYALNYAEEHNIVAGGREELPPSDTLVVSRFLHFETFAKLTHTCLEDLQRLNPKLQRNAVPEGKKYVLRIPASIKTDPTLNLSMILDSASRTGKKEVELLARNGTGSTYGRELSTYRVRNGDGLGVIAQRFRVRVEDIRTWNNLRGNLIHPGQLLSVWTLPAYRSMPAVPVTPQPVPVFPADAKMYIVQPGDTLWDISKKFEGLTIDKIKSLNNLKSNNLQPGQKLIVG